MPPRQSSAVDQALTLIREGNTPYAAAKQAGIALSTIYRALHRKENADVNRIVNKMRRQMARNEIC